MENGNSFGGAERWPDKPGEDFEELERQGERLEEEPEQFRMGAERAEIEAELPLPEEEEVPATTSEVVSGTVLDQEGRMVIRETTEKGEKMSVEKAQRLFAETYPDMDTAYGQMQEVRREVWEENGYGGGAQ